MDRARKYVGHKKLSIIPAPNRMLIKITRKQIDDLISKEITLDDGTKKRLFFEPILHAQGYDAAYRQNVSVGEVIGVGNDLDQFDVKVGDVAILDYLASTDDEELVGFFNGDKIISILAETTYYKESATIIHGKAGWLKGDFDNISRILGVVRGDKLMPFDPYVFLEYKSDLLKIVSPHGELHSLEKVYERTVLSAREGGDYKCGDVIRIKGDDLFERDVNGSKVSICFKSDILFKINDSILSK